MRKLFFPLMVLFLFTGCQSSGLVSPAPTVSKYFETTGGGFLIEDRGAMYVARYALIVKVIEPLPATALLQIVFENPKDIEEPLIVNYKVIPGQKEIKVQSPDLITLQSYKSYEVVINIFSDKSQTQLIGNHKQFIRSEMDLDYINKRSGNHRITEPWQFEFDERKWQLGFIQEVNNQKIIEYVLSGETVENWTELVTSFSKNQDVNLGELIEIIHDQIIKQYPSAKWKIIEKNDNYVLYEWSHKGNTGLSPEADLAIFRKLGTYVYSLTYAVKKDYIPEKNKTKWLNILKNAYTKK